MTAILKTEPLPGKSVTVRSRRPLSSKSRNILVGSAFLAPLIIGLLVFRGYGFSYNLWLSFHKAGSFGRPKWIGLENYRDLFSDTQFATALGNTLRFAVIGAPLVVIVALLCALLMQTQMRGGGAFRTIVFLPAVGLPTAIVLVFGWFFQTQYGLVNSFLEQTIGHGVSWLGSVETVTVVVTISLVYLSFSVPAVILYAGLKDIPQDVYEAASIDGASALRQFFSISLPLLTPSLFFVVLTVTISTLKLFDVVYLLLPPDQSLSVNYGITVLYYYYQLAFLDSGQRGYASAVSMALFAVILLISALLFGLQRRFVHYGDQSS